MDLKDKTVTIIGAAKSGVAAANLVRALGGTPRISDHQPREKIEGMLSALTDRSSVEIEAGGHTEDFVRKSDLVVASPGVWKDAGPLEWARAAGIPVMGEIEFAWRFCRKPVVAVTGSNGKTTTVTLIAKVLEAAGKKPCLCGNVGSPFSAHVLDRGVDIFVVEISSFQLELCETFRPRVALVTNFSQNHLDRHPTMEDYFEAKKRLFMNQTEEDVAILNARDEWSQRIPAGIRSRVVWFNKEDENVNPNHLAVLEVVRALGIPDAVAQKAFAEFRGVEHRLERVRTVDGVEYINDSKSTTAESGRWALERMERPVVLIVGGSEKNIDYAPLKDLVAKKARAVVAFGLIRERFRKAFEGAVPLEVVDGDLNEAVTRARTLARAGDCVLLCPMTASYDMFDNFEHRGRTFKQIVTEMAHA
ncbi:MAG: UDP-N-acetylmuramoyl-L-alanine--D-glutamate ligase [Elusimicrobia bacterium]|nr:UDP-N-acetylmuramoyl-L-alanine--D-glutamate ligase [Elusimicrobiota bacterium]